MLSFCCCFSIHLYLLSSFVLYSSDVFCVCVQLVSVYVPCPTCCMSVYTWVFGPSGTAEISQWLHSSAMNIFSLGSMTIVHGSWQINKIKFVNEGGLYITTNYTFELQSTDIFIGFFCLVLYILEWLRLFLKDIFAGKINKYKSW